jgi:hypothetical protein
MILDEEHRWLRRSVAQTGMAPLCDRTYAHSRMRSFEQAILHLSSAALLFAAQLDIVSLNNPISSTGTIS